MSQIFKSEYMNRELLSKQKKKKYKNKVVSTSIATEIFAAKVSKIQGSNKQILHNP